MTTTYQIIYWRDIPAQVKVKAGRERVSRPLPARFEQAIDQAAMNAGLVGTDEYLAEWHSSSWQERDGDLEAVAEAVVNELRETYPRNRVQKMVDNGGRETE